MDRALVAGDLEEQPSLGRPPTQAVFARSILLALATSAGSHRPTNRFWQQDIVPIKCDDLRFASAVHFPHSIHRSVTRSAERPIQTGATAAVQKRPVIDFTKVHLGTLGRLRSKRKPSGGDVAFS